MFVLAGFGAAVAAVLTFVLIRLGGLGSDVPNLRSSHVVPVPRGGGLAFPMTLALMVPLAIAVGAYPSLSEQPSTLLLLLPAFGCALLGLVEDVRRLPVAPRFLFETALAVTTALLGWRWQSLNLGFGSFALNDVASLCLTVLWILWVVNLYNFMDGVNGMAALVGLSFCVVFALLGHQTGLGTVAITMTLVGSALVGFLPFNFPRARIFMGDSGSLFLGFLVATAPLSVHAAAPRFSFVMAVVVMGPFGVDATLTLLYRLALRQKITEAHRMHAYQKLTDMAGGRHFVPTLAYAALSLVSGYFTYCWFDESRSWAPLAAVGIFVGLIVAYVAVQIAHGTISSKRAPDSH